MNTISTTTTQPAQPRRLHPQAYATKTLDGDLPRVVIFNVIAHCCRCDGPVHPGETLTFQPAGGWAHYTCEVAWWESAQLRMIDGGAVGGQGVLVTLDVIHNDGDIL